MATSTTFEERLQRIGAERAEIPGATRQVALPDEKGTNRILLVGLGVVLMLAVGVSIASAVLSPRASDDKGPLAEDGWAPVVSKGLVVGSGERVDDGWHKVAAPE